VVNFVIGAYINHCLLYCIVSAGMDHQSPATIKCHCTVSARPWRQLDIEKLHYALQMSPICLSDEWPDDVKAMADMFDEVISLISSFPFASLFAKRGRVISACFDWEPRDAKRLTGGSDHAHAAAVRSAAAPCPSTAATLLSPTTSTATESSAETAWSK
jgi:hypothetical protein